MWVKFSITRSNRSKNLGDLVILTYLGQIITHGTNCIKIIGSFFKSAVLTDLFFYFDSILVVGSQMKYHDYPQKGNFILCLLDLLEKFVLIL